MVKIKKIIFIIFIIILAISAITFRCPIKNFCINFWNKSSLKFPFINKKQPVERINVFVHGAFGSMMGFLDFFKVLNDDVKKTTYSKTTSQMRKDPYFYKTQPILQRGLVKIDPTFNLSKTKNQKFAAYPIIKSYKEILHELNPDEINHFYTFGWSGLISQHRRRLEAIRFYNALSEEIEKFKEAGINPQVRIIAHSHGGNLCLNLAATKTVLQNFDNPKNLETFAQNNDEKESLFKMYEIMKTLDSKQTAKTKNGQKLYTYLPENKDLVVDELIIMGTPIQPETEYFAYNNNIFKKFYNFYSDEDDVQKADIFSTKQGSSNQRFKTNKNQKQKNQVIQAKIMMDRNFFQENTTTNTAFNKTYEEHELGFWSKLFSSEGAFFRKQQNDPSHRELWFASWSTKAKPQGVKNTILSPLPTVILIPLLLSAIEKINLKTNDIDFNIKATGTKLIINTHKHNGTEVQKRVSISRKLIEEIKEKMLKWEPDDISQEKEYSIIKNYLKKL